MISVTVKKYRLTYFSPEPNRQGHASYTHVQEIVRNLAILGWQVGLFCPEYTQKRLPGAVARAIGIASTLMRVIFRRRPDVYYMRWHFAAWPLACWAKIVGVPTVVEVNGPIDDLFIAWPYTRRFRAFFSWLMKSQLNWSDAVVAVTPGLVSLSKKICGEEKFVSLIPNGANTDVFSPEAAKEVNGLTEILPRRFLIFFGTMARWQGIRTILEAIEEPAWPAGMHVVFAGDGEDREFVEMAVERLDHVHYYGRVPYQTLATIVARATGALVCPENLEGRAVTGLAPLKLFESLSSGVPVIATDQPFQAELIREENCGIVIEPGQPEVLANAVSKLVESEDQRLKWSENARRVVVQSHSWLARAKDTDSVLQTVLSFKAK